MKKKGRVFAILLTVLSASCASREDAGLQWLLGLAPPPSGDIPFTIGVSDVQGTPDFIFDTARTIPVFVSVRDAVAPVSGSLVQVLEHPESGDGRVLFQAVTSPEGTITGNFSIATASKTVEVVVTVSGRTLRFSVDISNVQEIRRFIFLDAAITPVVIVDTDGDSVPDAQDAYPNDASRSARVLIPGNSYYTIAFEDLYPSQGDADFNDYVVRVTNEEDLNAAGQVVRVRGSYTHIACGAGYRHNLRLKLPGASGQYILNIYAPAGTLEQSQTGALTAGAYLDLFAGQNSHQTLGYMANTKQGQAVLQGRRAEFELILDQPVSRTTLSSAPYDLYLWVLNTSREIHFLGRYFKADGTDQYLDPKGFPWALMIAGAWKWPYERTNIHNAYAFFDDWYISLGLNNSDWYAFPNLDLVFPFE